MNTENWEIKARVECPDVWFYSPIRIVARTIAAQLGIPCVVVSQWSADHLIWLSGSLQFHPEGPRIDGSKIINDRDFIGLNDNVRHEYIEYLGEQLLRTLSEFLHQEFRKKLGWTDEQKPR